MRDPLFETTSDATPRSTSDTVSHATPDPTSDHTASEARSDATSDGGSDATSDGRSEIATYAATDTAPAVVAASPVSATPTQPVQPMPPMQAMLPMHAVAPAGQPGSGQPYQWPAPTGAPTGATMTPPPPPAVGGRRSDTYRGLTIASFVLSIVAVVGVLLIGLMLLASPAGPDAALPDDVDSGPIVPLTGSVSAPAGRSLPGDDLANAVEQRIHDDGAGDVEMDCPDTRKVGQGVVTVCHGQIEGDDWAVIVYFEDELGSLTLNPL